MIRRTSPWLDTIPDALTFKPLQADVACDVVVVGGGLAGVMTAWYVAQAGKQVVLLEQNHVATGDTGYTTAFLTRVPDTLASDLVKRYGVEFVRRVFTAMSAAQRDVIQLIKTEQIDCDLREYPSYFSSYTADHPLLAQEWAAVQQVDPQAEWLEGDQLNAVQPKLAAAVRFNNEASYHVRKFVFGLLKSERARALQIYEETEVTNIQVQPKRVVVTTPHGRVVAGKLIMTSGLPAHMPELHSLFSPRLTFALTARYASAAPISNAQFWDTDTPYQYYRKIDDTTVMLGGCDRPASERSDISAYSTLRHWLDKYIPGATETTLEWSGSLFETSDGLPYITAHPQFSQQIYFACGFGGNGMVSSVLAGQMLAQQVAGLTDGRAELFSLKRTKASVGKSRLTETPRAAGQAAAPHRRWLIWLGKILAVAAWVTIIILPGKIFFELRGGLSVLDDLDTQVKSLIIFPLFGLYAFTLAWLQLVLGAGMMFWRKLFPKIEWFHRGEGLLTLLLALTHPLLIYIGFGAEIYFAREFVAPEMIRYVWLGYFQVIGMCLTVAAALLMRLSFMKRIWRYIHWLNYAIFASAWVHGWFLGSDVQATNLKYIWYVSGTTAVVALIYRIYVAIRPPQPAATTPATGEWVDAAAVAEVQPGKAHLATVGGSQIALFNFNGKYYALDNVCSHANGPLCEGTVTGNKVECPWHSSQFDITTGAVTAGPARRAQRTFPVKIEKDRIFVQL